MRKEKKKSREILHQMMEKIYIYFFCASFSLNCDWHPGTLIHKMKHEARRSKLRTFTKFIFISFCFFFLSCCSLQITQRISKLSSFTCYFFYEIKICILHLIYWSPCWERIILSLDANLELSKFSSDQSISWD